LAVRRGTIHTLAREECARLLAQDSAPALQRLRVLKANGNWETYWTTRARELTRIAA
jgi:hypothetical protein